MGVEASRSRRPERILPIPFDSVRHRFLRLLSNQAGWLAASSRPDRGARPRPRNGGDWRCLDDD